MKSLVPDKVLQVDKEGYAYNKGICNMAADGNKLAFVLLSTAIPANEYLSAFVSNFNRKSLINCYTGLTNKFAATSQILQRCTPLKSMQNPKIG